MLLAIETSTERAGVALCAGPRLLGERPLEAELQHAGRLLPAIDALLRSAGASLEAVEAIALSVGPGSFTGLRIGLATALGLCFGTARRIVPVPTLAALSLQAGDAARIAPLLDARKGQLYAGLYAAPARALREDCVTDPAPFLETLRGEGEVTFLGPGAELHAGAIRSALGRAARLLAAEAGWPRASSVAALGARLHARGGSQAPETVELCYLRASEAEVRRALHPWREPIP
jgi:tRNA threonylcarbamoyladenosine biosynthesis protein TsaB